MKRFCLDEVKGNSELEKETVVHILIHNDI